MLLYHGSPYSFSFFSCPSKGGPIRECEKDRKDFRDVVFMSLEKKYALQYAQAEGYLYEVEVADPVQYRTVAVRKKRGKAALGLSLPSVWIADPAECRIISKKRLLPRKRGEKQEYAIMTV